MTTAATDDIRPNKNHFPFGNKKDRTAAVSNPKQHTTSSVPSINGKKSPKAKRNPRSNITWKPVFVRR